MTSWLFLLILLVHYPTRTLSYYWVSMSTDGQEKDCSFWVHKQHIGLRTAPQRLISTLVLSQLVIITKARLSSHPADAATGRWHEETPPSWEKLGVNWLNVATYDGFSVLLDMQDKFEKHKKLFIQYPIKSSTPPHFHYILSFIFGFKESEVVKM